jgi:hypothetical protein
MFKAGLPPVTADFTTPEGTQSADLALAYIALNGTGSPENFEEYNSYYSNLKVMFHDTLQANMDKVNTAILVKIDADLKVTADIDPEVKQRWYPTGILINY